MNDFLTSLWGPNWGFHLVIVFLLALLINVGRDVIKRTRGWRGFWLSRKFSEEDLYSVRRLLYLAKAQRRAKGNKS
jgi:hypothetical protein